MKQKLSPEKATLLRNPTLDGALKFWPHALGTPIGDAPLAGLHKARLKWKGSTRVMKEESRKWLKENGYGTDPNGPDLTVPMAKPIKKQ